MMPTLLDLCLSDVLSLEDVLFIRPSFFVVQLWFDSVGPDRVCFNWSETSPEP